jgi:hypothetical protein
MIASTPAHSQPTSQRRVDTAHGIVIIPLVRYTITVYICLMCTEKPFYELAIRLGNPRSGNAGKREKTSNQDIYHDSMMTWQRGFAAMESHGGIRHWLMPVLALQHAFYFALPDSDPTLRAVVTRKTRCLPGPRIYPSYPDL